MVSLVTRWWLPDGQVEEYTPMTNKHGQFILADNGFAGLPVASTLRASRLAAIDVSRILRVAGRLSDEDQRFARNALAT